MITDLTPGDSYYIRAYAINQKGASYGEVKFISTVIGAPVLTTGAASDITQTQATISASLDSSGGGTVSERGILWSTSAPVTLDSNKVVSNGTSEGQFSVNLTSLPPGTTFYYKAYAINPNGIGYGEQKSFRTINGPPTIITNSISNIDSNQINIGGEIISNGGEEVINYGFVYSNVNSEPSLLDNIVVVGEQNHLGFFNTQISNLIPQTNYFIRSFATNSEGTSFGIVKEFQTLEGFYFGIINPNNQENLVVNNNYPIELS